MKLVFKAFIFGNDIIGIIIITTPKKIPQLENISLKLQEISNYKTQCGKRDKFM